MLRSTLLTISAIIALSSRPVQAQTIFNMKGTWIGQGQVVIIGPTPYRVPNKSGPNFPSNSVEFTLTFDQQEGNRFSGHSQAQNFTETLIGALQIDNKGGVILDDDGEYTFTMRDANTMDLCYRHLYPTSKAVGCYSVTRR